MPTGANAAILALIVLLAVVVTGIVVSMAVAKSKARREQRDAETIRAGILDYFSRSSVGVAVACIRLPGAKSYSAVIESEPMKRFRLSHIIEMTLREHVRKGCGLELDKVYWRFPVAQAVQAARAAQAGQGGQADQAAQPSIGVPAQSDAQAVVKEAEHPDEYINEGLEHYRHIPKPEVEELPWEQFEQVSTIGRHGQDTP